MTKKEKTQKELKIGKKNDEMFENHRKMRHSTLRAKRATFTF